MTDLFPLAGALAALADEPTLVDTTGKVEVRGIRYRFKARRSVVFDGFLISLERIAKGD